MADNKPPAWAMKAAQQFASESTLIAGSGIEKLARIIADACPAQRLAEVLREVARCHRCPSCASSAEAALRLLESAEWERSR